MKKIEVWSKELWEAPEKEIRLSTEELAGALEKYNF